MEKKIIKKIERVNRMLAEIEKELKETDNVMLKGLNAGQRIAYTFMKAELEDLLWEVKREEQC